MTLKSPAKPSGGKSLTAQYTFYGGCLKSMGWFCCFPFFEIRESLNVEK